MKTSIASPRVAERRPLPRVFYRRGAEEVAQALLGCQIVRRLSPSRKNSTREILLRGRIVETEAYVGEEDRACHAHAGPTPRNAIMYGEPGYAYVYLVYGMYDMLNVVCGPPGCPEAVLLRGIEPLDGIETMRRLRPVRRDVDLSNGPGKLCLSFVVTRAQNGADLRGNEIWITRGRPTSSEKVVRGARIGIDYAGADRLRPLRFYIAGNAFVSKRRT